MIKKKIHFTGSVFQFYLPEIKRYAFCKYFDFTHISKFHGLLAKVFDHFSDKEQNTLDGLKNSDWLFGARSMHRWPNLRKDSGWKSLGIMSSPEDEFVPDFKGVQSAHVIVEDESKIGPWYPIHNLIQRGRNCEYAAVHHLENKVLTVASLSLSWRTGMEYCRSRNLPVDEYYDLSDLGQKLVYLQMINVPAYKDIPIEIRGKAMADG
jgi:hypothetical protein